MSRVMDNVEAVAETSVSPHVIYQHHLGVCVRRCIGVYLLDSSCRFSEVVVGLWPCFTGRLGCVRLARR